MFCGVRQQNPSRKGFLKKERYVVIPYLNGLGAYGSPSGYDPDKKPINVLMWVHATITTSSFQTSIYGRESPEVTSIYIYDLYSQFRPVVAM